MPLQRIAVFFTYTKCTDGVYPVITVRPDKRIPELMIQRLSEEESFIVDVNEVKGALDVSAWQPTHKVTMAIRLLEVLDEWNQQHCGFAKLNRTLQVYTNLEGVGFRQFEPPPLDSPMRRIGVLRAELGQAVEFQEFEEADRLKKEIQSLTEGVNNAAR